VLLYSYYTTHIQETRKMIFAFLTIDHTDRVSEPSSNAAGDDIWFLSGPRIRKRERVTCRSVSLSW
jgi:hypothetical protein